MKLENHASVRPVVSVFCLMGALLFPAARAMGEEPPLTSLRDAQNERDKLKEAAARNNSGTERRGPVSPPTVEEPEDFPLNPPLWLVKVTEHNSWVEDPNMRAGRSLFEFWSDVSVKNLEKRPGAKRLEDGSWWVPNELAAADSIKTLRGPYSSAKQLLLAVEPEEMTEDQAEHLFYNFIGAIRRATRQRGSTDTPPVRTEPPLPEIDRNDPANFEEELRRRQTR